MTAHGDIPAPQNFQDERTEAGSSLDDVASKRRSAALRQAMGHPIIYLDVAAEFFPAVAVCS